MGKASRNKRREAARKGLGWVATAAARDAQRRRRHAAANVGGHSFLRSRDVERAETMLAEVAAAFEAEGMLRGQAQQRACQLVYASRGVVPPYDDPDAIAAALLAEDAETLASAELFIMSPAMQRATVAAAGTLSAVDVATLDADEDLPALHGVLVLAEPVVVRSSNGALADLRAFAWKPSRVFLGAPAEWSPGVRVTEFMDADGPVQSASYAAARAVSKQQGEPFPLLIPNQHRGMRSDGFGLAFSDEERDAELGLHRRHAAVIAESVDPARVVLNQEDHSVGAGYAGGVVDDATSDFVPRFMFAFWRLCQQRITATSRFADEPDAGGPVSPALGGTRIVRLRGWDTPGDSAGPSSSRRYAHRWVVRMHKVRQWYPAQGVHKVLWRGPYIKGPDGAPLLDGDKVQALLR